MTDRVTPKPAQYASCPYGGKILEYYSGQFDSVFILLHPFIRPTSLPIDRFCPEQWPTKQEFVSGCEDVTWDSVLPLTGLRDLSEIDIGLRTCIGGLKKERENQEFASKLNGLYDDHGIICPTEGDLPPLLENRVCEAIKSVGHEWLWVGDEFGMERKLHWIDDLIDKDEVPAHSCVFTHDHSLIVTTHWDSHCSFLGSSRETIDRFLDAGNFEGFFCSDNTEVYWGLYEI